ncbi:hypothetical protein ACFVFJ_48195 [Streptomyces sp. NPDC057717]|uniref:hypothetical protein n=1 Tax=Streptomyces sp. NPDC057717 TaxID=3346224 RepID=UPI0036A308C9
MSIEVSTHPYWSTLESGVVGARMALKHAHEAEDEAAEPTWPPRSICAAVVRPKGTRSVDAAVLLAQVMMPAPTRPGSRGALVMEQPVIPYERLLSVDVRCGEQRLVR